MAATRTAQAAAANPAAAPQAPEHQTAAANRLAPDRAAVAALHLRPRARRWVLLAHVVSSVGWLGVELCVLTLGIVSVAGTDPALVRGSRMIAGLLAESYYLPASLLALGTGLWLALGTRWGLVRHHWVLVKLVLTVALFVGGNLAVVPRFAEIAEIAAAGGEVGDGGVILITAMTAGLTLLLVSTLLSVLKPWGRTRWFPRPRTR